MAVSIVNVAQFWGFNPKNSKMLNAADATDFLENYSKKENVTMTDLISVVVENADLVLNPDGTLKNDGLI
jgi:hypothetical protein